MDKANIPDNVFYTTINSFNSQLEKLSEDKTKYSQQLEHDGAKQTDVLKWAALVEQYANLDKLTRQIAHELIDTITVSEFYKQDGKTMQDVTINYKFVGNITPQERTDEVAV